MRMVARAYGDACDGPKSSQVGIPGQRKRRWRWPTGTRQRASPSTARPLAPNTPLRATWFLTISRPRAHVQHRGRLDAWQRAHEQFDEARVGRLGFVHDLPELRGHADDQRLAQILITTCLIRASRCCCGSRWVHQAVNYLSERNWCPSVIEVASAVPTGPMLAIVIRRSVTSFRDIRTGRSQSICEPAGGGRAPAATTWEGSGTSNRRPSSISRGVISAHRTHTGRRP